MESNRFSSLRRAVVGSGRCVRFAQTSEIVGRRRKVIY